ncbi:AraC family transcriptional regulator [Flavilitoribacter nigricans]|uniref:AraC family transcriptional regulator n=1 Tax=Flavilitoribacter nigricans (strain ATCC 23147 / DSM 23189 / NBRC 102662 / NCIMB 1420 / SS-2) TaxID=1122177 RepID=A0A2D0NA24_FLAN2|nr:AraC family transcriptional regulator [Flavilitoribacter nigricans]PHN04999.1 AraC family transcriptional regulator [Flavilitoribacter nigricans DSM 23189 = NBRC 102662]
MKIIAFTIPVRQDQTVIVKREVDTRFYPHLHRHEEVQLSWIQKGAGALLVGEHLHDFSPGDIFLFSANLPHLFKNDLQEDGIEAFSLFFKKDNPLWALPELHQIAQFLQQMEGAFLVKQDLRREVGECLEAIEHRPAELRLPLFIELMQGLVRRSGLELIGASTVPLVSDQEGLRVNTVLQFAMTHYDRTITLEEIAGQVHMAPGSFCRFFKKRTGKTFIRFLNEIRVREACRLLTDQPDRQISEIAFQCGFKNVSSFNRVFRQIQDQSPTEYLLSIREVV